MSTHKKVDWLIIGAGPAGIQLGYFCKENNIDHLILEKGSSVATFYKKFPRHKRLTSINKVYTGCDNKKINLRWDWNSLLTQNNQLLFNQFSNKYFPERSALVRYLKAFAKLYALNIQFQTTVTSIRKETGFIVQTDKNVVYTCNKLFIATGVSKPYIPNIPGILFSRNYIDMPINQKNFINKRVLIIGKGNSALETANHLLATASLIHIVSPTPIKMAWQSHFAGDLRAINNHFLETYQLKSQNAVMNASIDKIMLKNDKYHVTFYYNMTRGEVETHSYDEVITCTGFQFDDSIFDSTCRPKLTKNNRFPHVTSHYESTNIKDLYFIGTLMQMSDFRKKQSRFIHGFRYNIAFLFKLLFASKNHASYPHQTLKGDITFLMQHIIMRINTTSSLWQQTGYLADAIIYDPSSDTVNYFDAVPKDFVLEGGLGVNRHFFLITLEFGQERIDQCADIFAIDRIHKDDYERAHLSTSLHPLVRHYYNSHLLSEHHVIEDFENVWSEAVHKEPLLDYLQKEIAKVRMEASVKQSENKS